MKTNSTIDLARKIMRQDGFNSYLIEVAQHNNAGTWYRYMAIAATTQQNRKAVVC